MGEYRQVLNAAALKTLAKTPNIPDYHLMVGVAEELAPLPLLVAANTAIPTEIVKNMNQMSDLSNEDIAIAIANGTFEVNDINGNMALLGSGLGV